ncbi:Staphylococcal nuclease homologue [uncultured archaeon]|nr:Staphylococcal nuclease homologue [uncultured archaeon]
MKKGNLILLFLFILSGVLYYLYFSPEISGNAVFEKREVNITRIVDGDTIVVNGDEKIRLLGINTPEKGEFNAEADVVFIKQLENKSVVVESSEKDKYGRTLGYVFYNGQLFNELILKNGLAHFYSYAEDKYSDKLRAAEKAAREKELGIWKKSSNYGCISLKELKYEEDGQRCTNKEQLVLENSCAKLSVYLKDDTSQGYHYNISSGVFVKNYSCKFNDAGDSLYIWGNDGLILFYRYP